MSVRHTIANYVIHTVVDGMHNIGIELLYYPPYDAVYKAVDNAIHDSIQLTVSGAVYKAEFSSEELELVKSLIVLTQESKRLCV